MIITISIVLNNTSIGQILSNKGTIFKVVTVKSRIILKDSFTIITNKVKIFDEEGVLIDNNQYTIDNDKIILKENGFNKYVNKVLKITYQRLHIDLGRHYTHLDSIAYKNSEKAIYIEYDLYKRDDNSQIMPTSLDYDGSFSRGFSIGNKQSLVLNSNLNLQMNGDIGSGIKLKAAISDANIPIQPEGSTQRLNEFDKVFIEISKDDNALVAGDFEIKNPKGYFSRYSKKLKGIKYTNLTKLKKNKKIKSLLSFAISKGKFGRNKLKVINGNQGPYKLKGASGERYLIVLSGTEKVYLDGKLLKRGRDFDYVIDYNLAEITFIKTMVTENSRIIVEFEYSDQNYLRSLQTITSVYGDSTTNFYINYYNEQDSKTAKGLLDLDTLDIQLLKNSGDNTEQSFKSGIREISDTSFTDKILYKKVFEPSINNFILKYTPNKDSAEYFVYFSDFGENNGSYSIDKTKRLQRRVYKWVGKGNGRYEPKIQLIPPQKKQMISLGANTKLSKSIKVSSEISISNVDKNRFSEINNDDNIGFAGVIKANIKKRIKVDSNYLVIKNNSFYEYAGIDFNPLNPYRSTEFQRDWNLNNDLSNSMEHLFENDFSVELSNIRFSYNYSGFIRKEDFRGNKHISKLNYQYKGFTLLAEGNLLLSQGNFEKTNFFRPKFDISQRVGFLNDVKIGFSFDKEKNDINILASDSLANNSFNYDNYKFYLSTKSSNNANLNFYLGYRKDYLPSENMFKEYTGATMVGISGNWNVKSKSKLKYDISFRQLDIINNISSNKKPESNILGKLHHILNVFKGSLYSNTNVEFGSGQQAKSEYIFVFAGLGKKGDYIWRDENNDSLKQNNEFIRVTGIDTADYIRITQYNNEFQRVNSTLFNNTIKINGSKFYSKTPKGIKKFISKLTLYSILRMTQKTLSSESGYFPVINDLKDTSLVSYIFNYTATMYFNRGNPAYDLNFGYKNIARQNNQVGGFTQNSIDEYFGALRLNYKNNVDLISKVAYGNRSYLVENTESGNYLFNYYSLGQEVNIFFSRKFGIKFNYKYTDRKNQWGDLEKAFLHNLKVSAKILKFKKTKINISTSYVNIDYTGGNSQIVELAILDGLKDGNNFIWDIRFSKRMKNNLDIIFQYNGRKSQDSKVLHQGKMQVRASF